MILVRKTTEGAWVEWHGDEDVAVDVATLTAHYHDGRIEELACDPYPVTKRLNGDTLARLAADGVWTLGELADAGGAIAVLFNVPDGKRAVGGPFYVEDKGTLRQVYEIEDIPPPPSTEEKLARLLEDYGLSKEDLREGLGL
jgi:hypothetical protein